MYSLFVYTSDVDPDTQYGRPPGSRLQVSTGTGTGTYLSKSNANLRKIVLNIFNLRFFSKYYSKTMKST